MEMWTCLILICVSSTSILSVRGDRVVIMEQTFKKIIRESDHEETKLHVQDSGHAENCGPPETKMQFSWEPKTIDPQGSVKLMLDMIAPVDFNTGKVTAAVYVADMSTPVFDYVQPITCSLVETFIKGMCPKGKITKNDHIIASTTYNGLKKLPVGTFTVVANVTNQQNQVFVCAKITFTVSG